MALDVGTSGTAAGQDARRGNDAGAPRTGAAASFAHGFGKVMRAIGLVGLAISAVCLLIMLFWTTLSVVGRYTGWFTILGAEQVAAYAMAGMFFFGLSYTFESGGFVAVAPLKRRMPERVLPWLEALHLVIAFAFVAVLAYYTWETVLESKRFETETFGVLEWPLWLPQLVMPIGCAALALQILSLLVDRIVLGRPVPLTDVEEADL